MDSEKVDRLLLVDQRKIPVVLRHGIDHCTAPPAISAASATLSAAPIRQSRTPGVA